MSEAQSNAIRAYYDTLFSAKGCQHRWPAQSHFEMIVGVYLTQNTSWNVEKALRNLRKTRLLSLEGIRSAPQSELECSIRSAGYFRRESSASKRS
jgi:endonuclease III related protein